jgi:hypothetical protein
VLYLLTEHIVKGQFHPAWLGHLVANRGPGVERVGVIGPQGEDLRIPILFLQACHACDPPPQFVYIGRNIMHGDRDNGVDLKYVRDIVISQNVIYGYRDASTSDGSAIVLGSDGAPNRPWVIFNEIFDSRNGIRNEATDTAVIIGNKIYDIEGFAIGLEKHSDDLYIIGNTIYDVGVGIDQFWRETFRLHIFNNIFAHMSNGDVHLNIESQKVADASELGHNLFWQGGEPVIIRWGKGGGGNYGSTAELAGFAGGANNLIGDPLFADAANSDFSLQQGSAAIDAGLPHTAYDEFVKLHGIDIRLDFAGAVRPPQSHWDIGAYEHMGYVGTAVREQTATPTKFALQSYPNPFNATTTIKFETPISTRVVVEILNISGRKVAVLADGHYEAGTYEIKWDGKDQDRRQAASGPYFYQLKTDERILARKMLLLK